jgi:hypothetical protein
VMGALGRKGQGEDPSTAGKRCAMLRRSLVDIADRMFFLRR